MDLTPSSILGALRNLAAIPTKLSQLTNDTNFTTPTAVNNQVNSQTVPRYAKAHMTDASGNLSVTWPAGRFNKIPIMPDPTIVVSDTAYVYKATVTACTLTGCTIKVTRQTNQVASLTGLTALNLNVPIAAPMQVNVFAIQETD